MNRKSLLIVILIMLPVFLFSQETAGDFFTKISNKYSEIESYTANFKFTSGVKANIIQEGSISYMSPNLLRLDYTDPENQVLCVNSRKMSLYVPYHQTLFEQTINSEADAKALETSGLTSQGLLLFKTNYSISYLNGPELEVLDDNNPEEVYKLRLLPRKSSEPFRKIIISITEEGYIRRVESHTRGDETIILDIVDIDPEAKLTKKIFDYDAPPTATTIKDFLFTPGED